jgi:hypothetical protein
MAFKTHIDNATGNQPGQVTTLLTGALSEGVHNLLRGDFAVTGTAGLAVEVAKGEAYVFNDSYIYGTMDQRIFSVASSATESVNIDSNNSGNPRIDIICIKVDTAVPPGVQGVNASSVVVVTGTPASSPVPPAVPDNHLLLAEVYVANGASAISNSDITDKRVQASVGTINGPAGFLVNGRIVPSVASNNLTVAIKTLAGNDPSPGEPVWCRIGNQLVIITSSLSVTRNAGTNWFNSGSSELATQEIDYFVYLGFNATDGVTIGFARIPYARQYGGFNTTSTNERYAAISTITNAASTDPYEVVGRFAATLSAGPSYTWSIPSYTSVNLIQRPIYSTRDLNYSPVYTGFSAAPTNVVSTYRIIDNYVDLFYRAGQPGTSNATNLQISLPFSVITLMSYEIRHYSRGTNNGSTVVSDVTYTISSGATVLTAQLGGNSNGWTNANGKKLDWADAMYRIA